MQVLIWKPECRWPYGGRRSCVGPIPYPGDLRYTQGCPCSSGRGALEFLQETHGPAAGASGLVLQTHSDTCDAGISRRPFFSLQSFVAFFSFLSFQALLSFVSLWKRGGWEPFIPTQHMGHYTRVLQGKKPHYIINISGV